MEPDDPLFSLMDERALLKWLMARTDKRWVITRARGATTVCADLTTPHGLYFQFETTLPSRRDAIIRACMRVWMLRQRGLQDLNFAKMAKTLQERE